MAESNLDPTGQSNADGKSGESKTGTSFQVSKDPVVYGEAEVLTDGIVEGDSHKFEVAPRPVESTLAPVFEDLGELPKSYNEDTLFLTARDPRWLFTYWDFDWGHYAPSGMRGGISQFFLKITTAAGAQEALVEINPEARNWYVPVSQSGVEYFAEVGFFNKAGAWHKIVHSAPVATPADGLDEDTAAAFATVPAHLTFERLLELVKEKMMEGESLITALARIAGEGQIAFRAGQAPTWSGEQKRLLALLLGDTLIEKIGLGSEEIDQLLRKQLQEKLHSESASGLSLGAALAESLAPGPHSLFSGIGASWSAQPFSTRRERGFFMHVNAEIIFYGGTHPDATVWIDGKEIKLSPDGSFRYHYTLPDGDFAIPIIARSPDKVEQRSATLSFVRGTYKSGKVDDTAQPPELAPLIGKK
jgi:uncharacterized protein